MDKKYILMYGGGFGDVLLNYLMLEAGYLESLKEKEPDCKIVVAIMSHNISSRSIFENHPLIDKIIYKECDNMYSKFFHEMSKDYTIIKAHGSLQYGFSIQTQREYILLDNLIYKQPSFYLTDKEKMTADNILSMKNFTVIHPFAGEESRSFKNKLDLRKIIDNLCNSGTTVVLLGGSSDRTIINSCRLTEEFDYERDKLVNLINKHSAALQSYICSNATNFIGTMSCFSCVAEACKIPSMVFGPLKNKHYLKPYVVGQLKHIFHLYMENSTEVHYYENLPLDINDQIKRFCEEKVLDL